MDRLVDYLMDNISNLTSARNIADTLTIVQYFVDQSGLAATEVASEQQYGYVFLHFSSNFVMRRKDTNFQDLTTNYTNITNFNCKNLRHKCLNVYEFTASFRVSNSPPFAALATKFQDNSFNSFNS